MHVCVCERGEREHIILPSHYIYRKWLPTLFVCVCDTFKSHVRKKNNQNAKNQTELQQNREVSVPANCHICTIYFPIFQQAH